MARIDEYLQKILSARYGEEVRGAIHDSIDEINRVNEANISTVQTIADTAQGYADDAEDSKDLAAQSVTDAQAQVTLAQQQVTLATTQATNSANSAEDSEAWAVGQRGGIDVPSSDETYQNNSKYWQERANYWYQKAQAIAESFSGALRPMGTVTFENLPPLAQVDSGDMYNISNQFTTTSDFVEGAGIVVPLGSNVYKTTGGKWDVLAGSPVTGVKGNSESTYRRGNVNITKSNIGLGNVDNTSDANKPVSTAQQTALNSKQNITDNSLTTTSKTIPGAINEIKSDLPKEIARVTADGVKTTSTLLNELLSLLSLLSSPLSEHAKIVLTDHYDVFSIQGVNRFNHSAMAEGQIIMQEILLNANNSTFKEVIISTGSVIFNNWSSSVTPSGVSFIVYD